MGCSRSFLGILEKESYGKQTRFWSPESHGFFPEVQNLYTR